MTKKSEAQDSYTFVVPKDEKGIRIDQFLAKQLPKHSRTFIKTLIEAQHLIVNEKVVNKTSYKIEAGDTIYLTIPHAQPLHPIPKSELPTNISIKHEQAEFLIICKPPYLAVHPPNPKFKESTLIDWLLDQYEDLKEVGYEDRPGIVHRLDKDTSGILIIVRSNQAHQAFTQLFKERKIHKTYLAVVEGNPPPTGSINFLIRRHPKHRNKMTSSTSEGREAETRYRVLTYYENAALLEVKPISGRTHQIRVHMAAIGHPIVGDLLYGNKSPFIKRQALHAYELTFSFENKDYTFACPPPADFQELVSLLKPIESFT